MTRTTKGKQKKGYSPKWTNRHTKVVNEFLESCKKGTVKFFIMEDGKYIPQSDKENKAECKRLWQNHLKTFGDKGN